MKNTLRNFKNILKLQIPDPNFVETKTAFEKKKMYLKGRVKEGGREGQMGKRGPCISWFTPKMATMAGVAPGHSKELPPGIGHGGRGARTGAVPF